jgi:hypothetical protein
VITTTAKGKAETYGIGVRTAFFRAVMEELQRQRGDLPGEMALLANHPRSG